MLLLTHLLSTLCSAVTRAMRTPRSKLEDLPLQTSHLQHHWKELSSR